MSDLKLQLIIEALNKTDKAFAELRGDLNRVTKNIDKMSAHSGAAGKAMSGHMHAATQKVGLFNGAVMNASMQLMMLQMVIQQIGAGLNALVFQFNSTLETATLGIATAFISGGKYIDETTGKALEGQAALRAAQGDSKRILEELQVANFQTIATLDQLTRAYQETLPVAMARGFDRTQVKEFTVGMVQAAGAIGLAMDQLGEETRSLLTGNITRNSRIAKVLGLEPKDVAQFKGDADGLFTFLMKKLDAYKIAGLESQKTWAGVWSNTLDIINQVSAKVSTPLFEGVKRDLKDIADGIVIIDTTTGQIKWNEDFLDGVEKAQEGVAALYLLITASSKAIAAFGGAASDKWLNALSLMAKVVESLESIEGFDKVLERLAQTMGNSVFGAGGGLFNGAIDTALKEINDQFGKRFPVPDRNPKSKYVQNATSSDDEETAKKLKAAQKSAKGITDAWQLMHRDRWAVKSRSLDVEIQMEKEAAELNKKTWETSKDFWQLQEEDKQEVHSRSLDAQIETEADAMVQMTQFGVQAARNIQDSFAEFLFDPFENGLSGMLQSFGDTVREMLSQVAANQILSGLFSGMAGSENSFLAGLGKAFGGKNADGNVFSAGQIIPHANGGVVMSPTFFPMANGKFGLMGEAGEEAIMPLTRIGGKLGVRAEGMGGGNINLTILNQGEPVKAASVSQSRGSDGTRELVIQLEKKLAGRLTSQGGALAGAFERTYGLSRTGNR